MDAWINKKKLTLFSTPLKLRLAKKADPNCIFALFYLQSTLLLDTIVLYILHIHVTGYRPQLTEDNNKNQNADSLHFIASFLLSHNVDIKVVGVLFALSHKHYKIPLCFSFSFFKRVGLWQIL